MKLIACLALSLLALAGQPAFAAAPPVPGIPVDDAPAVARARSGSLDNAAMRAALEARKEKVERATQRRSQGEADDCKDCPEAARRHPHPAAGEAPKVDCTHCIDRPAYA